MSVAAGQLGLDGTVPSLDREAPNAHWTRGGPIATNSHRRRVQREPPGSTLGRSPVSVSAATRRELLAIGRDRLRELEPGSKAAQLWTRFVTNLETCGWVLAYVNGNTGTVVGLPCFHCNQPLCPYDAMRSIARLRDRYRARHDQALADRRLFLAILTIPNVPRGELESAFERLRRAIARLRRQKWWAADVLGGIWRLELTVNLETGSWHPHANLLFETRTRIRYAEWQPRIQAAWRAALGETEKQWAWLYPGWSGALPETIKRQVRRAKLAVTVDRGDGATSIDYTVKPTPRDWIRAGDPGWVLEYVETRAGRRSVSSFGQWRKPAKPDRAEPVEELVSAPYSAGAEDPWGPVRKLPRYDPTLPVGPGAEARWQPLGQVPRRVFRLARGPGEGRQDWLVWRPGDADDPREAMDDTSFAYQAGLPLGQPARA